MNYCSQTTCGQVFLSMYSYCAVARLGIVLPCAVAPTLQIGTGGSSRLKWGLEEEVGLIPGSSQIWNWETF